MEEHRALLPFEIEYEKSSNHMHSRLYFNEYTDRNYIVKEPLKPLGFIFDKHGSAIRKAFYRNNCFTLSDILDKGPFEVAKLPMIGKSNFKEISEKLKEYGIDDFNLDENRNKHRWDNSYRVYWYLYPERTPDYDETYILD